jgi:NAD(P)-dependent dehydrogenase (short-subunit alcohol dehydrogenase family)
MARVRNLFEINNITGRTALITGASSGLGGHCAMVLSKAGAQVIAAARREEALRELVRNGLAKSYIVIDVRDESSVAEAFSKIEPIDILVNAAGVALTKPVLDQDAADWDDIVGTNARGAFLVATEAARVMREAGRQGSIINIASIAGVRQTGQVATYAISKAAVVQMTKVMALELARYNIRVNAISPGYFHTDLNHHFWETGAGQALIKRIPQRRLGRLHDLDGPLLLLASNASAFMTGTNIVVDGGHLISAL